MDSDDEIIGSRRPKAQPRTPISRPNTEDTPGHKPLRGQKRSIITPRKRNFTNNSDTSSATTSDGETSSDDDLPLIPRKKEKTQVNKGRIDRPSTSKTKQKAKASPKTRTVKKVKSAKKTSSTPTRRKKRSESDDEEEDDLPVYEKGDARRYFKAGQKEICPPNGDGTRSFYESLLNEKPNSSLAIKYCIEHGTLAGTSHRLNYEKYKLIKEANLLPASLQGGRRPEAEELLNSYNMKTEV